MLSVNANKLAATAVDRAALEPRPAPMGRPRDFSWIVRTPGGRLAIEGMDKQSVRIGGAV